MADPEHVNVVKQGPNAFEAWRERNLNKRLDLIGADLSRADLSDAAWLSLVF